MTPQSKVPTAAHSDAAAGAEEEEPQVQPVGSGGLARRTRVLLPGVLDGADVVQAGRRRGDQPPKLFFAPTLDQFRAVFDQGIGPAMLNSLFATGISTILVLLLGVPAAFALSLRPVRKTQDALFFFMSTKMLPVVAAIMPMYVIVVQYRSAGQHLGAGHPLHVDEPADRGLDDAVILPRGARRTARGRQPRWREPVARGASNT